jgi:hypothetical protein
MDSTPGSTERAYLPHPEIFAAMKKGVQLLLDDGKIRMEVEDCGSDFAVGRVIAGGVLSERKGVSVVGAVLPLAALTDKDRTDLEFALGQGADADLGTLQVLQDADWAASAGLDGTDRVQSLLVIFARAVAEIEPEDVGAGVKQLLDNRLVGTRGPESGDDLGFAKTAHPGLPAYVALHDDPSIARLPARPNVRFHASGRMLASYSKY